VSDEIGDPPQFRDGAKLLRQQLATGRPIEEALTTLRAATVGSIIPIGAVMVPLRISLKDARELVETSPAFNDEARAHDPFRRQLLERLAPHIETASRPTGQDPDYLRNDLGEDDRDDTHHRR
jgi:hypothetical protein